MHGLVRDSAHSQREFGAVQGCKLLLKAKPGKYTQAYVLSSINAKKINKALVNGLPSRAISMRKCVQKTSVAVC